MPRPKSIEKRQKKKWHLENLLQTKRRKTIATSVRTIYDLDSDKPNQKDRNIKKIITRVKLRNYGSYDRWRYRYHTLP